MAGTLYGIGVGPGDPELMTLKAVRLIGQCPVIAIPSEDRERCTAYQIAKGAYDRLDEKELLPLPIPMTKDRKKTEKAYEMSSQRLMKVLEEGKDIAFLTLGDPTVYATYFYIHEKVKHQGYDAKLISGVPSFCATAAALSVPLGERKECIHIIPASYDIDKSLQLEGTKILMKSAGRVGDVKNKLMKLEEDGICKAGAVTDCGMPAEQIYEQIKDLKEDAGYFTTIIMR